MKSQPSRHTKPWRLKSEEQEAEEDCSCSSRANSRCSKSNTASSGPVFKACIRISQTDKDLLLVWVPAYFIAYGKMSQKYLQIHKKYWEIFHHSILIFEGRELCRKLILQGKETRIKCVITITTDSVCIPAASIASTLFLLPLCKGKHLATKLRLTNTWSQYRPNQVYYQYKRIFCSGDRSKEAQLRPIFVKNWTGDCWVDSGNSTQA